jgi:lipid II:glycine glycyltransferase (peptidoglycan interpeptide bridge formation enzyme)
MPGYSIVRVRNFGGGSSEEVRRVALEALLMYARRGARVLRLHVNVFSREEREEIANLLATLGFRELNPPSSYRHTLAVDLKPSEEELFAALSKSARTRVRECVKKGLATVPITDLAYAARLEQLQKEALRRTGGHTASTNWEGVLTMSRDHPSLSRVLGVFTGESLAPENMKAFGWVCNHGETGEYRAAGSSRDGESRLPFGYAVVWEMIRWAKATGAHWFDMGGVTVSGGNDPLEGISDFKRFFSRELVEVGAEWVFEPSPLRARIANGVSGLRVQLQKSFDRCGGEGERVRPVSH